MDKDLSQLYNTRVTGPYNFHEDYFRSLQLSVEGIVGVCNGKIVKALDVPDMLVLAVIFEEPFRGWYSEQAWIRKYFNEYYFAESLRDCRRVFLSDGDHWWRVGYDGEGTNAPSILAQLWLRDMLREALGSINK